MNDAAAHNRTILDQFGKQAASFAKLPGHEDATRLLLDVAQVGANDTVLDVACGPGLVACSAAKRARHVVGADLTPEMIAQARAQQTKMGLSNVEWQIADAAALPFSTDQFSVALTRYSIHHFSVPRQVLAEMMRVTRPGGHVAVADLVLPPSKGAAYDSMERLRDPSHVRVLSHDELCMLMTSVGLDDIQWSGYLFELDLRTLLGGSFPNPGDADRVRSILERDVGVDSLGIGLHRFGDEIRFAYPIAIVVGTKTG